MAMPMLKYAMLGGAMCAADPAMAQQINSDWSPMPAAETTAPLPNASPKKPGRGPQGPRVAISPYLEAAQTLFADLNAGGDVLTYSSIAAGVDASMSTRRAQGQINLRYERRITNNSKGTDQDVIDGLARGSVAVTPNFGLEAGGVATRRSVDGRVAGASILFADSDNVTQVYSVYGGPTFSAQAGDINANAAYRAGYTKVENQSAVDLPEGQRRFGQFNESVSQVAAASVGAGPGLLPFGWAVSGNWKREETGQLDGRFDAKTVRGDVTWPLSPNLALAVGAGYEHIGIVERDAARDAEGFPLLGPDGRLVTDPGSPYLIVYHEDGLIWDAGISWRPGPRTSFEARFGRRYGSNTFTGSLNYRPTRDWTLNVSVFDTLTGFGGLLIDGLSALPTQFRSTRNPLSGELGGCIFGQASGSCLNETLQNASSAAFRQRGVAASFSGTINGWDSGFALGYNHRTYIAGRSGAQAEIDGLTDNNYFALASLGRSFGQRTRFESNLYASTFDPGTAGAFDTLSAGANAALYRQIIRGLSASAAVGLDHIKQESFASDVTASARLGLRYNF